MYSRKKKSEVEIIAKNRANQRYVLTICKTKLIATCINLSNHNLYVCGDYLKTFEHITAKDIAEHLYIYSFEGSRDFS